ncbi:MAG: hypothetical protein LBE27_06045 [Deltaproteobacteria bacterium]|jgi:hypothetical protein|nr:hypothetical protein [Deltaproteobacteria bacterium]
MKNLKHLAIVGAMAILLTAALMSGCGDKKQAEDAWLSFQLVMNKAFGENQWSSTSHSFQNGILTVQGVSATLDQMKLGTESLNQFLTNPLKIDTITVTNILPAKDMKTLFDSENWSGNADQALATQVSMRGLSTNQNFDDEELTFSVEAAQLDQIVLKVPTGKSVPGFLGFLKSLNLGKSSYKNLSVSLKSKNQPASGNAYLSVDSYSLTALRFNDQGLLGDDSLMDILFAAKIDQVEWAMVKFGFQDGDDEKHDFTLASASMKNLDGLGKFGSFLLKDLSLDSKSKDLGIKGANFKLSDLSLTNLDASLVYKDLLSGLRGQDILSGSPDTDALIESNLQNFPKISFLFSYPYDLDSWKMANLMVSVNGLNFGVGALDYQGPVKRNVIPNSKITLSNMTLDLGNVSLLSDTDAKDLKAFTDAFGMTKFTLAGDVEVNYQGDAGNVKYTCNNLNVDSLFSLSFDTELTGFTQELITAYSEVPLKEFYLILMAPGAEKIGIKTLSLNYTDNSFFKRMISYANADTPDKSQADFMNELQANVIDNLEAIIGGNSPPEFFQTYAQYVGDFFQDPKAIKLSLTPENPVTIIDIIGVSETNRDEVLEFVNSLNITFSANNEPDTKVEFKEDEY